MKKIIFGIIVFVLLISGSIYAVAESTNEMNQRSYTHRKSSELGDTTLITELYNNRVIEVDNVGTIVWMKSGLNEPTDAERLKNGNTLIAEMGANRVIEINSDGNIVWQYSNLFGPFDAERLENGNTLISDTYSNRVIEVDSSGSVVWEKVLSGWVIDAERLENGNTLMVDWDNDRVIEVDSSGIIVWQVSAMAPADVERLESGNTLITQYITEQRVKEVDSSGNLVWQYVSSGILFDAERLENGNTLITEFLYGDRVIEVETSGTIVWEKTGLNMPLDAERILLQPDLDCIGYLTWTGVKPGSPATGSFLVENIGDSGSELDWEVKEWPTWGTWTFTPKNGTDLTPEDGTVTIEVNVIAPNEKNQNFTGDVKIVNSEDDSDFCIVPASLSTPKNKEYNFKFPLLNWLFESFPITFIILRLLLGVT